VEGTCGGMAMRVLLPMLCLMMFHCQKWGGDEEVDAQKHFMSNQTVD
jgi:hypothetical protein